MPLRDTASSSHGSKLSKKKCAKNSSLQEPNYDHLPSRLLKPKPNGKPEWQLLLPLPHELGQTNENP